MIVPAQLDIGVIIAKGAVMESIKKASFARGTLNLSVKGCITWPTVRQFR